MNAKATSFATPKDLRSYIKCRDNGGSTNFCLGVGDNGEGCFGDETWDVRRPPMCAIPLSEMELKWGTKHLARGKRVKVTLASGASCIAECRDQAPSGVIDLNPAALVALGLAFDTELSIMAEWEWID